MSAAASTTTREMGRMRYFLHRLAISTCRLAATKYTPIQDGSSASRKLCERCAVSVLEVVTPWQGGLVSGHLPAIWPRFPHFSDNGVYQDLTQWQGVKYYCFFSEV